MSLRWAAVLAGGLIASCGKPKTTAPAPEVSTIKLDASKPAASHEWTAAEREKATAFGDEIARKLNANDAAGVGTCINAREIVAAAYAELSDPSPEMKGFREKLEGELTRNPGTFFATLRDARCRFLRTLDGPDGPRLLVRAVLPSGACSYLEFLPYIAPDGSVRIRDLYNHATGGNLLGIVRSVFVTMGPVTKSSALDRLFGSEAEANRTLVEQALGAMKSRKAADARAVYARLPPALKKNRLLYTGLIQVLMTEPDDPAYAAALADGVVLFPGDATVDFLGVDLHLIQKNFPAMQAAIDRLQKRLGPDAHLFVLEAVGKVKAGDPAGARAALDRALELEPDNDLARSYLTTVAAQGKAPDDAPDVAPAMPEAVSSPPPVEKESR